MEDMAHSLHDKDLVVAADIGGSHITVAPVDLSTGQALAQKSLRTRVNSKGSKAEILAAWARAVQQVRDSLPQMTTRLAFAMPGPFDYAKGISHIKGLDKYEELYHVDVKSELAAILGIAYEDILFRNDAEAFLHGEVATGLVATNERVLGLTLGTGVGTAFSFDGTTANLELGSEAYRGSIVDDYFSTRWFVGRYAEVYGGHIADVRALVSLADGEHVRKFLFTEYAANLADFLAPHILRMEVDTLVIGGNISNAQEFFLSGFLAKLASKQIRPHVKLAQQGEKSAIIGAAYLFKEINGMYEAI